MHTKTILTIYPIENTFEWGIWDVTIRRRLARSSILSSGRRTTEFFFIYIIFMHIKRLQVFLSSFFPSSGIGSFFDSIFRYAHPFRLQHHWEMCWNDRNRRNSKILCSEKHIQLTENGVWYWWIQLVSHSREHVVHAVLVDGKCNASSSFWFMPK